VCPCGETLSVPTMLEIAALEPAEEELAPESAQTEEAWGGDRRMLMLGAVMLLVAVVLGVLNYGKRPKAPIDALDPDMLRRGIQTMPPMITWQNWKAAKQGLDRRPDQQYADALTVYRWKQGFALLLAVVGAVLVGLGTARLRKSASPRGPSPTQNDTVLAHKRMGE
jgi:hypothetical protein